MTNRHCKVLVLHGPLLCRGLVQCYNRTLSF